MMYRWIAALAFAAALLVPGLALAVVTEIDMSVIEGGAMEESVVIIDSTGKQIGTTKTDDRGIAAPVNLPEGSGHRVRFSDGSTSEPFAVTGTQTNKVKLRRRGGAAVLGGSSGAAAVRVAGDDRPVNFELELNYQYGETNVQQTANIPALNSVLSPNRESRVLYSDDIGGALRLVGPKFCDVARPFVQLRGVTNFNKDTISGGTFGEEGVTGLAWTRLQQNYQIHAGLGIAVPMRVGPVVLTAKPYAGYTWDQYTVRLFGDERAFGFPEVTGPRKDITVGSVEVGGQLDLQPCYSCGFYVFGGVGWRMPVVGDKRRVNGETPGGFEDTAVVRFTNNAVVNAGVGWKF